MCKEDTANWTKLQEAGRRRCLVMQAVRDRVETGKRKDEKTVNLKGCISSLEGSAKEAEQPIGH